MEPLRFRFWRMTRGMILVRHTRIMPKLFLLVQLEIDELWVVGLDCIR